ncbi:MAG: hypothetical protein Q8O67_22280 [Deltaproteobacteria bacterium]|nr:hypothetical protein [Deltaproteobacteria bacterium]
MVTEQDIEGYLTKMGVQFQELGRKTWMIRDADGDDAVDNLVVTLNDPVIVFHVKLLDIPEGCDRLSLYEELLRLNASEMLHGAYGLAGNAIVATDTLQAENLDFNEFQASVDALNLCITSHYKQLSSLVTKPKKAGGSMAGRIGKS